MPRKRVGGESVHVRLERDQAEFIERVADVHGLNFSEALRTCIENVMLQVGDDFAAVRELYIEAHVITEDEDLP